MDECGCGLAALLNRRAERVERERRASSALLDNVLAQRLDHQFGPVALHGRRTQRPGLRDALERAVALIVSSQNDQGGWRYEPRPADADISVTVMQLVALRAACR